MPRPILGAVLEILMSAMLGRPSTDLIQCPLYQVSPGYRNLGNNYLGIHDKWKNLFSVDLPHSSLIYF